MDIEVLEERHHGVLVLLPVRRLDSGNARAFESIVMGHINSGERHLIVDFSRLDFISSAGLRVALLATRALEASQGRIVLCAMKKHIAEPSGRHCQRKTGLIRRDASCKCLWMKSPFRYFKTSPEIIRLAVMM